MYIAKSLHLCSIIILIALTSCSTVGPGLMNHPSDCAIGIPWADCLPGTKGYANGGGRVHREAAHQQQNAKETAWKAVRDQCVADMQAHELDSIRDKVELVRESADMAPTFATVTNDTFPTEEERPAIAAWAKARENCQRRALDADPAPGDLTPLQATFRQKDRSFDMEMAAQVGQLVVALYQQKLTYGEFGQKRYELTRDLLKAKNEFRQTAMLADQARQAEAQQRAQDQFAKNLQAFAAYNQSVAARQPQTIHIVDDTVRLPRQTNCTSTRVGDTVQTNCN